MKNLLEMKKIYHYYGKARALEEINLKIEEKALDAVIGPNGAGKSTLLRVISGLEEPDRGKMVFLGERIDGLKAHKITKKGISHCPERRRLFYDMTVEDNLKMGAYILKDKATYKNENLDWKYSEGWIQLDDLGIDIDEMLKGVFLDVTHETPLEEKIDSQKIISRGIGRTTKFE